MTHTILIVDDAPDWRDMLAGLIGDVFSEIEIITAASMGEAKSCLDQHNFKLAIIDLRLDDSDEENVDGLELAEFIHTQKAIPVAVELPEAGEGGAAPSLSERKSCSGLSIGLLSVW